MTDGVSQSENEFNTKTDRDENKCWKIHTEALLPGVRSVVSY